MGTYVNQHLGKDENVIHETKLHWITFLRLRGIISLGILPFLDYITTEMAITNKKVVGKYGFIFRKTLEMNLPKIESISVDQGVLGRILGYGTITVIGTGGTKEELCYMSNPLEFRKKFQEIT